jgi:hypothetical protein
VCSALRPEWLSGGEQGFDGFVAENEEGSHRPETGQETLVRGRIALIRKGSKTVIGVADLVRTLPKLPQSELKASVDKHRVPDSDISIDFKHSTAWVLQRARSLREPVPYRHPAGAVIWVNLAPEVAAMVEQRLALAAEARSN